MSSKLPVPAKLPPAVKVTKAPKNRDPRFDSLCGTFDERVFRKAYKFVDDIREKEKEELKEQLETESDPTRKANIKYLIQRIENQERERKRREEKEQQQKQEHQDRVDMMKRGEKPHFPRKAERKAQELVTRFEELKKTGKLQKHIEKQRKKSNVKDRKRLKVLD